MKSRDFSGFDIPMRLIFGKSVVGGSPTGDVFDAVSSAPASVARRVCRPARLRACCLLNPAAPSNRRPVAPLFAVLEGAQSRSHGRTDSRARAAATTRERLIVPLLACNHQPVAAEIAITISCPPGDRRDCLHALSGRSGATHPARSSLRPLTRRMGRLDLTATAGIATIEKCHDAGLRRRRRRPASVSRPRQCRSS